MLQGAGFGIVNNCAGLFYQPVAQTLGVSIGAISVYSSISIIASCFVMLFATQLLERYKANRILTLGAICTSAPMVVLAFCNRIWQWYLLAAIQGFGLAFTMNLVAPIILNNWFHEKLGLAVGLSVSSGGILGAIMSYVIGQILQNGTWRTAYLVSGLVGLILTLPGCLFILCMHPQDKGLEPYGEKKQSSQAAAQESACAPHAGIAWLLRDLRLWKLLPIILVARVNTGFMPHLTTYGSSLGLAVSQATLLTTLFMLGNIASKLSFGPLNDRWGAKRCSYLGLLIVLISEILLLTGQQGTMMAGALLFGTISMFSQVQLTLICRNLWSGSEYVKSMVVVSICAQLAYSLGISGIGFAYDHLGTYQKILGVLIASVLVGLFFVYTVFRTPNGGKVRKNTHGAGQSEF